MDYITQIHRYRWFLGGLVMLIVSVLILGTSRLSLDARYNAYFDPEDELLKVHAELSDTYSQFDSIVVILENLKGDMLTAEALEIISVLTSEAQQLPDVARVTSIDSLLLHDPEIPQSLDEVLKLPRVRQLLMSENGRFALVNIAYRPSNNHSSDQILKRMQGIRTLVSDTTSVNRSETTEVEAHFTGTLALNETYINVVRHDMRLFLPTLFVAFLVCIGAFFYSYRIALVVFLQVVGTIGGAFGMAGWLGFKLASIHSFVPVIIASISIAGCVHILHVYFSQNESTDSPVTAMQQSIQSNLLPLSLTNLTTALGFLSLAMSPSPPIRLVGYMVATGIALSWLMSLTILPAFITGCPCKPASYMNFRFLLAGLARLTRRYPRIVVAGFGIVMAPGIFWLQTSTISDDIFDYFPKSHQFTRDTALAENQLSGVHELTYSLETGEPLGIFNSDYLKVLEQFSAWLKQQKEIKRVLTITDLLPLEMIDEENIQIYRQKALDQPDISSLFEQDIAPHYSATRVQLFLLHLDARELIEFDKRTRLWLETNATPFAFSGGASASLIFATLSQRNAKSMFISLGAALLIIALIVGLVMRSLRVVWIGMACNLFPVMIVYSLWALAGGYISLGAAVVMGMILGIVVDDTIYLLIRHFRFTQAGDFRAVERAILHTGPALIATTITLCTGLSIGMLSNFTPIFTMSILSVGIMLAALATDLLLLPSLLHLGGDKNYTGIDSKPS